MRNFLLRATGISVSMALLAATAIADDAKQQAVKKDRALYEGTWQVVALDVNGNVAKMEDAKKITVVNGSDGTWKLLIDGKEIGGGTSTIDPTQNPKTIDIKITEGEGAGNLHRGIYEIGKNARKLCFADAGQDRPTRFSSDGDNQHVLVEFKRAK